jgi:NosR/NirI family nitrous oxide reductase transcriptional regulator
MTRRPQAFLLDRGFLLLLILLALILHLTPVSAASAAKSLDEFLAKVSPAEIFPGADKYGEPVGDPPVVPVMRGDKQLGYVFVNSDFFNSTGYSGKPIQVLISLDEDAVIRGAKLVEHSEPIVLVGIPESKITAVIDEYVGLDVAAYAAGELKHELDIVSGATVTVMVIDDSIVRSAIKVAHKLSLAGLEPLEGEPAGPQRVVDTGISGTKDWDTLTGEGSVRRLQITVGEINRAFAESADPEAARRPESGAEVDTFIDLYAAQVSVPTIGQSLLGEDEYRNLIARLDEGQSAFLLMGEGRYSFKGSGYVRGGIFDRFQVVQGETSIRFRDKNHKRLRRIAADGAPRFKEVDLFILPEVAEFDPAEPWRLELLVARPTGPVSKAFLTFDLGYSVPDIYLKTVPPLPSRSVPTEAAPAPRPAASGAEGPPLWQRIWRQKTAQIVILVGAIGILTIAFFFQNWLARRPRLVDGFRVGFLLFTLFWIGFYANAQLSVVNVMAFFNALLTDFHWEYFLADPLIFILWSSVAASLIFWGRGAYCGWLCPFGALQELLNRLAKLARIPQVRVPWGLHERLWPLKYMIFLPLFGISLYSLSLAEQLAEVEPFKTAIILKFLRAWPFVLFAIGLLAAGLFIERFYCRYLCALGAALAIPGRIRTFEWLRRYKECGSPCQRCANECMVQSIHPEGHINPNECLYCLHCQVLYHDDQRCPVMIQKRLKRERRQALSGKGPAVTKPASTEAGKAEFTGVDQNT